MSEHIQGWMVTAGAILLGFLASIIDNRRHAKERMRQTEIKCDDTQKELVSHKRDEVTRAGSLIREKQCEEYRGDFGKSMRHLEESMKEDITRVETSASGLHVKLDTAICNHHTRDH